MPYFDDLNSIVTRYQNHVGGYDKAKWEQTVEQRILHGITHIPTKSAKLQSELIDLDLVRGSSFPKAKPKHGLFTVTRLALLRCFFLPVFHKWWSTQTSPKLFIIFLVLYTVQLLNLFLYIHNPPLPTFSSSATNPSLENVIPFGPVNIVNGTSRGNLNNNSNMLDSTTIQTSEILSPVVLMIVLTILHSQIVATHGNDYDGHHGAKEHGRIRRNSGTGLSGKHRSKRRPPRYPPRRRSSNLVSVKTASNNSTITQVQSKSGCISSCSNNGNTNSACSSRTCIANSESSSNPSNKKVFFEDESKSWTSSNSDKDEGIAEEIINEHPETGDVDHESQFATSSTQNKTSLEFDEKSIQENLAASLKEFADAEEEIFKLQKSSPECLTPGDGDSSSQTLIVPERRSNLRKRNTSKQSEASTTSHSCGECSSNNNDSTSEEDDIGEETMEDEEVRTKSEWTAVTTNSEDDDYGENIHINSEDDEDGEPTDAQLNDHPFAWEFEQQSTKTASPSCASSDKVSCTIWDGQDARKADLTVLDISSTIIAKVECARENSDYLYLGICFSCVLAFLPCFWRLNTTLEVDDFEISRLGHYLVDAVNSAYGTDLRSRFMITISILERLTLALFVFFLLAVAEKTYKQRFLYSKLFSRLTSSRKARKSGIPHFRLNKVRNIKTWLSIRSYLQRRGPQRSVDTIVSATFIAALILIFFLSVELLKDSNRMYYLYNIEVIAWSLCLGIFLMRFMTLGSRISQKYRNLSVIITEQLNLYLKMEQKPHKKDELLVANNVLKLAAELLKELEDPFKISSFASNPYLYNVTRLVILSAFSGVLSEMLGFKLKLYKIKIK